MFSWPPYGIGQAIIFLSCGLFYLSIFYLLFPRLISAVADGCLPYFYTWCGLSANLECRSEMCCMRLAGNTGRKNDVKIAIWAPSYNFVGPYLRNKGTEKNLLNSNISPRCRYNMENFGQLALKICWRVWGTPCSKFQRVSRLGSVTARHSRSGRQLNFAALNRRRHILLMAALCNWADHYIFAL